MPDADGRKRVLILCTGNSCRSQMAEGFVNLLLSREWEARSAGTKPAARVHPLAVKAMAEAGVDISSGVPEVVDRYLDEPWDLVVTVCDAARETCPAFPAPWRGSTSPSTTPPGPGAPRTRGWRSSAVCATRSGIVWSGLSARGDALGERLVSFHVAQGPELLELVGGDVLRGLLRGARGVTPLPSSQEPLQLAGEGRLLADPIREPSVLTDPPRLKLSRVDALVSVPVLDVGPLRGPNRALVRSPEARLAHEEPGE